MDLSTAYISMCRKALEIQTRDWLIGDFYAISDDFVNICSGYDLNSPFMHDWVWLPRQDQMQKIMRDDDESGWGCLASFVWHVQEWLKDVQLTWSLEQLWLAYLMNKKHGKEWSEEDWRPIPWLNK